MYNTFYPFPAAKRVGTADFYPHPEHRIAGDIDLWFGNKTQTEQANQRMEKLGLPVKRGTNGEASCLINRVLIEHHSRLIELHNLSSKKKSANGKRGSLPTAKANFRAKRIIYYFPPTY